MIEWEKLKKTTAGLDKETRDYGPKLEDNRTKKYIELLKQKKVQSHFFKSQ